MPCFVFCQLTAETFVDFVVCWQKLNRQKMTFQKLVKLQCKCFGISEIVKPSSEPLKITLQQYCIAKTYETPTFQNLCNCQSKWGDWHAICKNSWKYIEMISGWKHDLLLRFDEMEVHKSKKSKCHLEALSAILNKSKKTKSFKMSLLWRKEWLAKMSVVNWKPNKQKEALKLFFDRLVVDFVHLDTFLVLSPA